MSVRAPPPPEGDLFAHFGVALDRRSEPLGPLDGRVVDGRPCASCRWLVALDAERCPLCGRAMDQR